MTAFVENTRVVAEGEPVGLFTEGAAGIAVIVLAILALVGVASPALAAIATIVIGVGLMAQGFNTAAENARLPVAAGTEFDSEVMVDCLAGGAGIVLGILALLGLDAAALLPAALIVFGGALLLSGALALRSPAAILRGSAATGGMELLMGIAATVLGILSLVMAHTAVLILVGFITLGAALLIVSATFGTALMRVLAATGE